MRLYPIGEVSKSLDISVQAIRLYQKKNLIQPTNIDKVTGYRYYNDDDISMIWRIKILQSAGFRLSEIKDLDNTSVDEIENVLNVKRCELEKEISIKSISLCYLDRQLEAVKLLNKTHEIVIKHIPDRYGEAFDYDMSKSIFDHYKDLAGIKGTHGLNQEVVYLPSRRYDIADEKAVVKDLFAIYPEEEGKLSYQKGGKYICLKVKGKKKSAKNYQQLFQYAKENGYTLRGDAIEILLINNNLVNNSDMNLREIQVALI